MKAKINKDRVELTELRVQNSGSLNYYEIECEFDESWDGLTKEIVIAQETEGIHRAIINSKAYIDKKYSGRYTIGFVGYTIEDEVKTYQISTNLVPIVMVKGAGEISITRETVPTPTEWETYIAQIQAMVDEIKDLPSYDITQEDIENWNNKVTDDDYVHTDNNFTDEEKEKLGSVEEGAEVNKVDDVKVNGTSVVSNKVANITVPTKTSQIQNDSNFVSDANYIHTDNNFTTAQKNKLAELENYDDTEVKQDIQALNSDVEGLGTSKQDKQDINLQTTDKTVVGAINELKTATDSKVNTSDIVNTVVSTDTDKPLSANMGKELQDEIDNLKSRGRFLALWNSATGLAMSNPQTSPYTYTTGDYFIVGNIGTTNYKPSGSTYTIGVASTVVETDVVAVDDVYYYDGTNWKLQVNTQKTVSFANIAGQPTDNTNLANVLNDKVGFTDYASTSKGGVVKVDVDIYGLCINPSTGRLLVAQATSNDINQKTQQYKPITPSNLEHAIKVGITTNTIQLSQSEKDTALEWLGVINYIESLDIEEVDF